MFIGRGTGKSFKRSHQRAPHRSVSMKGRFSADDDPGMTPPLQWSGGLLGKVLLLSCFTNCHLPLRYPLGIEWHLHCQMVQSLRGTRGTYPNHLNPDTKTPGSSIFPYRFVTLAVRNTCTPFEPHPPRILIQMPHPPSQSFKSPSPTLRQKSGGWQDFPPCILQYVWDEGVPGWAESLSDLCKTEKLSSVLGRWERGNFYVWKALHIGRRLCCRKHTPSQSLSIAIDTA